MGSKDQLHPPGDNGISLTICPTFNRLQMCHYLPVPRTWKGLRIIFKMGKSKNHKSPRLLSKINWSKLFLKLMIVVAAPKYWNHEVWYLPLSCMLVLLCFNWIELNILWMLHSAVLWAHRFYFIILVPRFSNPYLSSVKGAANFM